MAKKRKINRNQSTIPPLTLDRAPVDLGAALRAIAGALRRLADLLLELARQL